MSNNEFYDINDIRLIQEFRITTISGYKKSDVKKELIKSLLESDVEPSCYWSAELICSGHYAELCDLLINFFTKHIHMGNPMLTLYVEKRIYEFRNIVRTGYIQNELAMRNNIKVRNLFAEIISILCSSTKRHKLEEVKVKVEYFDLTNIQSKLKAPDVTYGKHVFKDDDPKELFIAINEFTYNLSTDGKDILLACFWVEWIMTYKRICKSKKRPCKCETRNLGDIDANYQTEPDWMIWEILIMQSQQKNMPCIEKLVRSLYQLYIFRYTPVSYKKRRFVVYLAISVIVDGIKNSKQIIPEQSKIMAKSTIYNINNVYKQIKQKEQIERTDQLYSESNTQIDKTIGKLDKIQNITDSFIPRL